MLCRVWAVVKEVSQFKFSITSKSEILMLPDLKKISEIIQKTAEVEILPLFQKLKDHEISEKKSGEIVTAADINAERKLTEALMAVTPGSVTVGEEAVTNDPSILDRLKGDKPIWIIDPLDGTRNFANGVKCFAIIVAYCHGGETLAGWIYDPVNEMMFSASKGKGTWVDDKRLEIKKSPSTIDMVGSVSKRHSDVLDKHRPSPDIPGVMLRYRCVGREYTDLALGVLHFSEYGMLKPWDHAAGVLIHSEAGGFSAFTVDQTAYFPGPTTQKHFLAAANKDDWQELRELFVET